MTFDSLNLSPALLRAVRDEGYTTPTPIQVKAIPLVLAGRDVLGCAQTGTGKTAAFALPILQRLQSTPQPHGKRRIRVLTLAPTRELAAQIDESFAVYGARTNLKHMVIFGGVGQSPQTRALERGVDVVAATPGRLLDLMNQGYVDLGAVEVFVLDEADRMLDMGFIHDIRKIVKELPRERQTLLFSATLPSAIQQLAGGILIDPVRVSVTPPSSTVEAIEQSLFYAERDEKIPLLIELLNARDISRALVFSRTKHGANKIVKKLLQADIHAAAIHGNKSQNAREQALAGFKAGDVRVLVATDIAARGLDVDEVSHVINFDLSHEPEVYVHRIGRTGRAGATGVAYSFCATEERPLLRQIERLIKKRITVAPTRITATPKTTSTPRPAETRPAPAKTKHTPAPAKTRPARAKAKPTPAPVKTTPTPSPTPAPPTPTSRPKQGESAADRKRQAYGRRNRWHSPG